MPVQKIVSKSAESLKPTRKVINVHDEKIQFAIQDLLDTLAAEQARLDALHPGEGRGVGLAANQIDYPVERYGEGFEIPNIYVLSIRPERAAKEGCEPVPPSVFINSVLTPLSEKIYRPEACLSVMGFVGLNVPRYERAQVAAMNEKGEPLDITTSGFIAQAHQHETDHGEGSEYLGRMPFSVSELQAILDWVSAREESAAPEATWVVEGKLQCVSASPDLFAMTVWAKHALLASTAVSTLDTVSPK